MSKSPSGFSGGAKANKVLGKPSGTPTPKVASKPVPTGLNTAKKPSATKPTATKTPAPTTGAKPAFAPGKVPNNAKKLTAGAPVIGASRMANPAKAPQAVNAQRMNSTFKKLGF
ncbi:MAG: hypothetical protein WC718_11425 [Phycisphaerales bacterium]|jgi:hypothetical protein